MDQMTSGLHVVGINLKTTQPRFFLNAIKMRIILELPTGDGQFQVFFILSLLFLFIGKYIFNELKHMTPLMEKLDAFTRL